MVMAQLKEHPMPDKLFVPDDADAKSAPPEIVTVDLYNPTRARRVIFDGIPPLGPHGVMHSITVEVGETKKAVRITRQIEQELRDRNRVNRDSDLIPSKPAGTEQAA
jgi:hypothetical protein